MAAPPPAPSVIRHDLGRTAAVAVWVATVFVASVVGWPPDHPVVALAIGLSGLLWALCWRPAVVLDTHAVTVRNPLRDVRIPWSVLDEASFGWALRLRAGALRCVAAAAPGPASMSVLYDRHRTPGGVLERDFVNQAGRQPAPALLAVRQWWSRVPAGRQPTAEDGDDVVTEDLSVTRPVPSIAALTTSAVLIIAASTWWIAAY